MSSTTETAPFTMPSAKVAMSIKQSQQAMNKLLSTCLGHHGLTVPQWMMLGVLSDGPQTPSALAKLLEIKPPYITLIIKELKQIDDIIIEATVPDDTRTKILTLSPNGEAFVATIEEKLQVCIQRELAQKITPTDLATFFSVSDYIAKNVKHVAA